MSIQQAKAAASAVNQRAFETLDTYYPPSRRNNDYDNLQAWIQEHPILAAFLVTQLVFSGGPVLFFLFFAITAFAVTIVAALFIALSIVFVVVGSAGLLLLPVLFITTSFATGFFLFGFAVYAAVQKFSTDPRTQSIRNHAKERYATTVQAAEQTSKKVATQAQQAALVAAGKVNEASNGQLEQSLAEGKKALEAQRAQNQTQVSPSVATHSSTPATSQPAQANTNSSNGSAVPTPYQNGGLDTAPAFNQTKASSRPALF